MSAKTFSICLLFSLSLLHLANGEYLSRGVDSIMRSLPGYQGKVPFKMYSGYLKASETHYSHYWLVESQSAPAFDPLVLWMNGGPGCSSVGGALEELGPFNLTDDVTLVVNEWSWNQKANVLFLEAPAGVGFSYSADFNVATDDDTTADHNYAALKDFFFQFPQFSRHDFYVTGESYAGIYVPTLVERIIDGMENSTINLKGLAIGNGVLNEDINTQTTIEFAYNHGLVDEDEYSKLVAQCCKGCIDQCYIHKAADKYCQMRAVEISALVWTGGLNPYDLYRTCWHNPNLGTVKPSNGYLAKLKWMSPPGVYDKLKQDSLDNETIIISDPICSNETAITAYLNPRKECCHKGSNSISNSVQ